MRALPHSFSRLPDDPFEGALAREITKSERLRLGIVAAVIGLIFARWLVVLLLFPQATEYQTGLAIPQVTLTVFWGAAFVYEATAFLFVSLLVRSNRQMPTFARYANALVETSLPTLTTLVALDVDSPLYGLFLPSNWGYFPFILMAILRLDFWLCTFTGAVAAVEYLGLAVYLGSLPQAAPLEPVLTAPIVHGTRAALLLGSGLLAGLISRRIRRHFAIVVRTLDERNRVVSTFGQHVSPAVVERLLAQDVESSGDVRHVCVMFVDIQDFTAFAEKRRPEEVVEYLNELFPGMIDAVNRHNGIVNKFLGDGFMAVFGAPVSDPDDCRNAVRAACEIVADVQARCASGALPPTRLRVGLHAGDAVTGNVGSPLRKEYTIIGDTVNLAARLEQLNKTFDSWVLISEAVRERLDGETVDAVPLGSVSVRGRDQPIPVYRLA